MHYIYKLPLSKQSQCWQCLRIEVVHLTLTGTNRKLIYQISNSVSVFKIITCLTGSEQVGPEGVKEVSLAKVSGEFYTWRIWVDQATSRQEPGVRIKDGKKAVGGQAGNSYHW